MNVYITDAGFSDVETERAIIEQAGHSLLLKQCKSKEDLLDQVVDADALIVQWAPISDQVINALDRCKVIIRYGIGGDNVDLKAAKAKGIPVCNIPDYCIDEVANHALAMAFALNRQLPQKQSVRRSRSRPIPRRANGYQPSSPLQRQGDSHIAHSLEQHR